MNHSEEIKAEAYHWAIKASNEILWTALGNYRPDGSVGIAKLSKAIRALAPKGSKILEDRVGNLWIDTRKNDEKTMFTAHLDAVHPRGKEGVIKLWWNADKTSISTQGAAVLGADDGAGVAILVSLLVSGVPARYLFTQGEETGGHGARYAVNAHADKVVGIDRCIAFDRRGDSDICGAQCVGNLASEAFVSALAGSLGLGHTWATGTYTDNSEWQGLIPEIVNISVGYDFNHSKQEVLDWVYFQRLRDAALSLDWESLPTEGPAPDDWDDTGKSSFYDDFWGPDQRMLDGDIPADVEDEALDLSDSLGILPSTYEGGLILDAISRAYRIGVSEGFRQ